MTKGCYSYLKHICSKPTDLIHDIKTVTTLIENKVSIREKNPVLAIILSLTHYQKPVFI
jgi:hypothetical protein